MLSCSLYRSKLCLPSSPAACSQTDPQVLPQVTLIPRGQAKGLTWFLPGEDPSLLSKQQIFARVVGALGGRAAEEVIFGDAEVTTGASGDLQQVCWYQPVCKAHSSYSSCCKLQGVRARACHQFGQALLKVY